MAKSEALLRDFPGMTRENSENPRSSSLRLDAHRADTYQ
jgi:hypothetical protein